MSKLKDIVKVVDEVRSKLSAVANELEGLSEPEPKTKFLVCKKPENAQWGGTRYRIKGNSVQFAVEVYSDEHANGVYITQAESDEDQYVFVLDRELGGLRDLLTHLIAKRGVK